MRLRIPRRRPHQRPHQRRPTSGAPTSGATSAPTSAPTSAAPATAPATAPSSTAAATTSRPDPRIEVPIDLGRAVAVTGTIEILSGPGDPAGDGGSADQAVLGEIVDVASGPDGTIALADRSAGRVRVVLPDGSITTVLGGRPGGPGRARLGRVGPVAVLEDGRIAAVDTSDDRIVIDEGGVAREILSPAELPDPRAMIATPGALIVADATMGLVVVPTSGGDRFPLDIADLPSPVALAEISEGRLAVVTGDDVVEVVFAAGADPTVARVIASAAPRPGDRVAVLPGGRCRSPCAAPGSWWPSRAPDRSRSISRRVACSRCCGRSSPRPARSWISRARAEPTPPLCCGPAGTAGRPPSSHSSTPTASSSPSPPGLVPAPRTASPRCCAAPGTRPS